MEGARLVDVALIRYEVDDAFFWLDRPQREADRVAIGGGGLVPSIIICNWSSIFVTSHLARTGRRSAGRQGSAERFKIA